MFHKVASNDVLTELTTNAGQRNGSAVLRVMLVSFLIYTEHTLACFQSDGFFPENKDFFKYGSQNRAISLLHSLRTLPWVSSGPLAL